MRITKKRAPALLNNQKGAIVLISGISILILIVFGFVSVHAGKTQPDVLRYVNPLIGTSNGGKE